MWRNESVFSYKYINTEAFSFSSLFLSSFLLSVWTFWFCPFSSRFRVLFLPEQNKNRRRQSFSAAAAPILYRIEWKSPKSHKTISALLSLSLFVFAVENMLPVKVKGEFSPLDHLLLSSLKHFFFSSGGC